MIVSILIGVALFLSVSVVAAVFAYLATGSGTPEIEWLGMKSRAEVPVSLIGTSIGGLSLARHHAAHVTLPWFIGDAMLVGIGAGAGLYLLIEYMQRIGTARARPTVASGDSDGSS